MIEDYKFTEKEKEAIERAKKIPMPFPTPTIPTEKIIPKYIGENIERSKQRRKLIDEIIEEIDVAVPRHCWRTAKDIIEKLEKLKEIS